MAFDAFLKIVGPEVYADSKKSDLQLLNFSFDIVTPKNAPDKGLNPGIKKGKIQFTKELDGATPALSVALTNQTRFREMVFTFFTTDSRSGNQLPYYRLTAKLPRITKIEYSTGSGGSVPSKHNTSFDQHEWERISIGEYHDVIEEHLQ